MNHIHISIQSESNLVSLLIKDYLIISSSTFTSATSFFSSIYFTYSILVSLIKAKGSKPKLKKNTDEIIAGCIFLSLK